MQGMIVVFKYGGTLKGVGVIDQTQCYKEQEYWHVKPVLWSQGSPLPRWVPAGSVAVINADAQAFTQAS